MLRLCSSSYIYLCFCHCPWSSQVLPGSCLPIRGPQQVAATSECFCGLAEMILFLWNGSLSRKEWIWNIIEWNIIISRYLFLAAKLPHKELGTILINCLYFHLFEQKKNFTFQYCYDNNILTFTFLTTFSISVGHDHWTIFTFVIRSFSVPSLDIFRENPFWTVIWRTTWKHHIVG